MKKLILASSNQFITNDSVNSFLPKPLNQSNILYVTTASKQNDNANYYVDLTRKKMDALNLTYTEFDITGKSEEELKHALASNDIVYVEGGSTFYLLKAIRKTSFVKILKEAIENGLVYWGVSAGSYIACPSIIMATWSNEYDRCGLTDWTAMSLVPFLVKAHYTPENLEFFTEKAKDLPLPLRVLNDQQALLVNDDGIRLLGDGNEIIL